MQAQNAREYQAVREELTTLRQCVTNYVGFVLSGSAVAFWSLTGKISEPMQAGEAAIVLAMVSMLVLFLLSYKFTSHNRYAGYCKLLTQEEFGGDPGITGDLFCWEICVDKLRKSDSKREGLLPECRDCHIPGIRSVESRIRCISGSKPEIDKLSWLKGLGLLLPLSGPEKEGSWKFPVYVARLFAAVNFIFMVFAAYFLLHGSIGGSVRVFRGYTVPKGFLLFSVGLVLLVFLWVTFASQLYKQMAGSETVEAFCWKFLPIRYGFARELDPTLSYRLRGLPREANSLAQGAGAS
jgi:hypothetical protein